MNQNTLTSIYYIGDYRGLIDSGVETDEFGYVYELLINLKERLEIRDFSCFIRANREVRSLVPLIMEKSKIIYDKWMIKIVEKFVHDRMYGYHTVLDEIRVSDDKWIPYGQAYAEISKMTGIDISRLIEIYGLKSKYYSEFELYQILLDLDRKSRQENFTIEGSHNYMYKMKTYDSINDDY